MTDRRDFLRQTACSILLGAMGAKALFAEAPPPPAPPKKVLKLIDEVKNTTAKSLKFVHDASTSKDRKDPKAVCLNCIQYKKMGEVDGVEVGRCNMITLGYAKSTGWSTSWARNLKVAY